MGRPKGSLSIRTKFIRAVSDKAIQAGITPLEVMLDNMRFYHEKAGDLLQQLLVDHAGMKLEKKLEIFQELAGCRARSQAAAEGAAPFVHARLTAVSVSGKIDHRPVLPENVSVQQAAEAYDQLLRSTAQEAGFQVIEHQPVNKENE